MDKDSNNSALLNSASTSSRDSESDKSLVGKFKDIISNTPLSKWFRKQADDNRVNSTPVIRRREDAFDDDLFEMQPPSKRSKPENDDTITPNTTITLNNNSRTFSNFPKPVAGSSGIKSHGKVVSDERMRRLVHNEQVDSDSEESTSGYSSVARIGSKEQVCESRDSSKQTSPLQEPGCSLFRSSGNTSRSLFTNRSPNANSSLSSRRPSFNTSIFGSPNFVDRTLSTKRIINSPFYNGRTIYGGASAYGRQLGKHPQDSPPTIKIKPVNQTKATNVVLGITARRILDTLDQYNSPVNDAKKMPVSKKGLLTKHTGANPYMKKAPRKGPVVAELQVPDLLKMKQRERLQESTESVRQMATSNPTSQTYKINPAASKGGYTNKMKPKPAGHRSGRTALWTNIPPPESEVNLPEISLPITTLPTFNDLKIPPPVQTTPSKPSELKMFSNTMSNFKAPSGKPPKLPIIFNSKPNSPAKQLNNAEYTFADPLIIAENLKSLIAMNNFKFSEPLGVQKHNGASLMEKFKPAEGTWECSACMLRNAATLSKCAACEGPRAKPPVKNGFGDQFKPAAGKWECSVCMIQNEATNAKCAACETPKGAPKVTNNGFGSQFKLGADKWECSVCMVRNDAAVEACVSCTTPKKSPAPAPLKSTPLGFGDKFKPSNSMWSCDVCLIRNKNELSKCAACKTPKPSAVLSFSAFKPPSDTWECGTCMIRNKVELLKCAACATVKPGVVLDGTNNFGEEFKRKTGDWECEWCMVFNKEGTDKCLCCETIRTGHNKDLQEITEKEPVSSFSFGVSNTPFTFGIPAASKTPEVPGSTGAASIFGDSAVKPVAPATTSAPAAPSFVFGVPTTAAEPPKVVEEAKLPEAVVAKETKVEEEKVPPNFGLFAATMKKPESAPVPAVTTMATPVSVPAPVVSSAAVTKPVMSFGTPILSNGEVKEKAPATQNLFTFGSTTSSSNPTANNVAAKPVETKSLFQFGAKTTASEPPANMFKPAMNNLFGSAAPKLGFGSDAPAFGSNATAAPPSFGSSTTTAPPSFGSSTTTAPPAFGSGTISTAPFGGVTTTAPPAFGISTATTAPPAYGSTTAPPAFGSSTATAPPVKPFTFAVSTPPANNNIGSNNSDQPPPSKMAMYSFGQSQPKPITFGSAAPVASFAAAPAQPATNLLFGTTSSTSGAKNGTYFGGNATASSQKAGFSFGSTFGAPASNTATPPSSGFNFNNPAASFDATAKPSYNFTGGCMTAFTAQPATDGGAAPQRKIKRAIRRTQR